MKTMIKCLLSAEWGSYTSLKVPFSGQFDLCSNAFGSSPLEPGLIGNDCVCMGCFRFPFVACSLLSMAISLGYEQHKQACNTSTHRTLEKKLHFLAPFRYDLASGGVQTAKL